MSDAKTLLLYGVHAVGATFAQAPTAVLECWLKQGAEQPELAHLAGLAQQLGVRVQRVTGDALDRLAESTAHQGVVIRRRPPRQWGLDEWLTDTLARTALPLALMIDQLQDPHNLGAVLRVADAAGAHGVILTKDRSVGVTAAVAKVASGALDTVPIVIVTNLARAMETLKKAGFWLVGASAEASDTLYAIDLRRPLAWVIGAEGSGLRRLTRESCDLLAKIPMYGTVGSLNLSTAAAVCLFETLRQRGEH
jgi:23S rRNA (guanosine2251-2'-O)-methyltransferase